MKVDTVVAQGNLVYGGTKAAITQLTRAMAKELGDLGGIRVNSVRPCVVNTELVKNLPEDYRRDIVKPVSDRMVFKRPVEPREVANIVIFLSSRMSSMVTGTSITIDGGHSLS